MLANHIGIGMPHLFGDPIDRSDAGGQQLTGVSVSALTGPMIVNPGREQVRLEKPIPDHEVADVR